MMTRKIVQYLLTALLPCVVLSTVAPAQPLPTGFESAFQIMAPRELSGRVAFQATIDGRERILILDLDARRIRKLIDDPGNNSYPTWSPDGRSISFSSDRDGNREIYTANWFGESVQRLTNSPAIDENPTWSPDGGRVLFQSARSNSDDANLLAVPVVGGQPQVLTSFSGRNTIPRWSPDGSFVAYSTNRFWPGWDVCFWNLNTRSERCILSGAKTYCRSSFALDGKRMTYSTGAFNQIDVGIVDLGTGERQEIASLPGKSYDAIFSPDGKHILFASEDGRTEIYNLYLASLNQTKWEVKPFLTSQHSLRFPSWSGIRTLELESERLRQEQAAAATAAAQPPPTATPDPSAAPETTTPVATP